MTRYMGVLTGTNRVGSIAPYLEETYDVGTKESDLEDTEPDGHLKLVFTDGHDRDSHCPGKSKQKSYFFPYEQASIKKCF